MRDHKQRLTKAQKLGAWIAGLGVALVATSFVMPTKALASNVPTRGNLFYTRYSTGTDLNRVKEVNFSFDGNALTVGTKSPVAQLTGGDGLTFAPDGDLLVAGQANNVYKINTATSAVQSVKSGTASAFHTSLDPSGKKVWV